MAQARARALVVGAGLSGSLCAALLRGALPAGALRVELWDKARGAGESGPGPGVGGKRGGRRRLGAP